MVAGVRVAHCTGRTYTRDVADRIEVVYALPERQRLVSVELVDGMTVGDAVRVSGLCKEFPELATGSFALGIYGEPADLGRRLRPGDRVEIYRALRMDPREARRRRAAGTPIRGRGSRR
jgi:putative ubiquitin-RnfH superfamily antitoxin RatB of RatAB toxin-antitoxin module